MTKCDFNKFALQLYWNHTLAWVFSLNLLHIFTTTFPKNTYGGLLLSKSFWHWLRTYVWCWYQRNQFCSKFIFFLLLLFRILCVSGGKKCSFVRILTLRLTITDIIWWSEFSEIKSYIVDNKAKGRISKRVFQENKARQVFRKMNISYSLIRSRVSSSHLLKKSVMESFNFCAVGKGKKNEKLGLN